MDTLPEDGTPEMERLVGKIEGVKFVLLWLGEAKDKQERSFQLGQLKSYGFERACDAEGWLRGLQRLGFDHRSMRRFTPYPIPQRRK